MLAPPATPKARSDEQTIRDFLRRLGHPVALVGLYPIDPRNPHDTYTIWPSDQGDDLPDQAAWLASQYASVYVNLNPLHDCLRRAIISPRLSIRDNMIARRSRILIDIDAHRGPKAIAFEQMRAIREEVGEPLLATDSGNGYGLIYACDLPADADSTYRVKTYLEALKSRYSCVDTSVHTLSRLTRVIGTPNRSKRTGERIPTTLL